MTQFKISCGRNGEEEAKAGHAYEWGESFGIVEAITLAATFGDEAGIEAGDVA
jgi:hypothetical protein